MNPSVAGIESAPGISGSGLFLEVDKRMLLAGIVIAKDYKKGAFAVHGADIGWSTWSRLSEADFCHDKLPLGVKQLLARETKNLWRFRDLVHDCAGVFMALKALEDLEVTSDVASVDDSKSADVDSGVVSLIEDKERVLACTSTTQLDAWLDRALSATRIEDVFADPTT